MSDSELTVQKKVDIEKSLFGIFPNDFDADDIHDERLSKK